MASTARRTGEIAKPVTIVTIRANRSRGCPAAMRPLEWARSITQGASKMKTSVTVCAGLVAIGLGASAMAGPLDDGWQKWGMTSERPALSYMRAKQIEFVMTCKDRSMHFHVRTFVPAQRWPQPELTLVFGTVERTKLPDVRLIGQYNGFETEFWIADSVLEPIRGGAAIQARFNGQESSFPAPPEALRREFADKCAALVPPTMRAG